MAPETAATRPARNGPKLRQASPEYRVGLMGEVGEVGEVVEVLEVGDAATPRIASRAKDVRLTISETLGLGMWRRGNNTTGREEAVRGGKPLPPPYRPFYRLSSTAPPLPAAGPSDSRTSVRTAPWPTPARQSSCARWRSGACSRPPCRRRPRASPWSWRRRAYRPYPPGTSR